MTPREIATSYDKLSTQWTGPDFDHAYGIAQHRRALQFVTRRGSALDAGCGGSGRIVELLLSSGSEVEGVDLSSEMLRLARARHPSVRFHQADLCDWRLPSTYSFISSWDGFWHVPLCRQEEVLRRLCAGLAPGGVLIFTTGGVDGPDERHDSSMGVPMYHAALGIPATLRVLAEADCICRHLEYDQFPEEHVYIVAQRAGTGPH